MSAPQPSSKEQLCFVEGMHCVGCELRIEKKISSLKGVTAVEALAAKGQVRIQYRGVRPTAESLNQLFPEDGYVFSEKPAAPQGTNKILTIAGISLVVALVVAFLLFGGSQLSSLVQVNARSSLPMFFLFGLMAGVSSCAALVGGIVLSMSRQWAAAYGDSDSWLQRSEPHLLFNTGRLIGFAALGAVLGAIGGRLQLSLTVSSLLVIVISGLMIFLGLEMLGVTKPGTGRLTAPRVLTRYISDESNFRGRYMPFLLGALTFFLPCGFTFTVQSLALLSGNPVQGALMMGFFALGTLPMLLTIGLSSTKLLSNPLTSGYFVKAAGVLVLVFAVYNINSQLNVMGMTSLSDLGLSSAGPVASASATGAKGPALPTLVNGVQVIRMDASAYGYRPRWFRVQAGVPVRWEIADKGTSGCTNAVISRSLFEGEIALTPGETSVAEFTPQRPGAYKFSCWMGMVWGVIEVVQEPVVPTTT